MRERLVRACLSILLLSACTNDYSKFDTDRPSNATGGSTSSGGSGAAGATTGGTTPGGTGGTSSGGTTAGGGTAGGGGTSSGGTNAGGTGAAGAAGSGGAGGTSGCGPAQKLCGASCVANDDPATGCAAPSCAACAIPNATAICAGAPPTCAFGTCSGNFANCNGQIGDGCEQDLSQPNTASCGSCGNDCTKQGYLGGFVCLAGPICGCTATTQCKDGGGGTAACNTSGRCVCSGVECVGGEVCKKNGSSQVCACNNGSPCVIGQTCCQVGGCKSLSTDPANCGACGRVCGSGKSCVGGVCQ